MSRLPTHWPVVIVLGVSGLIAGVASLKVQRAQTAEIVRQDQQMAAAAAALQEQGLPLTLEEFVDAFIERAGYEEDAGWHLRPVLYRLDDLQSEIWPELEIAEDDQLPRFDFEPALDELPEDWRTFTWDDLRQLLEESGDIIAKLEEAENAFRPQVETVHASLGPVLTIEQGLTQFEYPELSNVYTLTSLLRYRLLLAAHEGDADRVIETALWINGIADTVQAANPTFIAHLVSGGNRLRMTHGVQLVLPALNGITKGQVAELQAVLLDQTASTDHLTLAAKAEAVYQHGDIVHLRDEGPAIETVLRNVAPGLPGEQAVEFAAPSALFLAQQAGAIIHASQAETMPEARDRLKSVQDAMKNTSSVDLDLALRYLSFGGDDLWIERHFMSHFMIRNSQSLVAVALGLQAYRTDHDGDLPATLDRLVPDYLPFVPRDRMTADASIQYDPTRGIVWTVGRDGIDQGGISRADRVAELPNASTAQLEAVGWDEVVKILQSSRLRAKAH
jgi:hypothetical protein